MRRSEGGDDGREINISKEDIEQKVDNGDEILERSPASNIVKNIIKVFNWL